MISHINFNLRINLERRGIITYYQKNNITTVKKHVDADHVMLAKGFEEEMNSPLKQLVIKRPNVFNSKISNFFGAKDPFKRDVVQQKKFLQDLAFLVAKNHLPIQFLESTWLKRLIMHLCPKVAFPSRKIFSQAILVDWWRKQNNSMSCLN
jgi:hypothetical protein